MKHLISRAQYSLIVLMIIVSMSACVNNGGKSNNEKDSENIIFTPDYAKGFKIRGDSLNKSREILSVTPWQGADEQYSLMIVRDDVDIPEEYAGQILKGDAKRIVCMSSSHVAMLDELGVSDRIVGVSGKHFIYSSFIKNRIDDIYDIGYDNNIDYEALMAANPDLVMLYGVNGPNVMESKLKELGIPFIYVGDYIEDSPLGKAEWIVALGECLGIREIGEEKFLLIAERYESLRDSISSLRLKAAKVMLNTPYRDSWFLPPSGSYMARLINDAGGDYSFSNNYSNTSEAIDMEQALLMASKADKWINIGPQFSSLEELKNGLPKFSDIHTVRSGEVYNNTARSVKGGGNDFYESGIINPDKILRDLVIIFHPDIVNGELYYYYRMR